MVITWPSRVRRRTDDLSLDIIFITNWVNHASRSLLYCQVPRLMRKGSWSRRPVVTVPRDSPYHSALKKMQKLTCSDRCPIIRSIAKLQPLRFHQDSDDTPLEFSALWSIPIVCNNFAHLSFFALPPYGPRLSSAFITYLKSALGEEGREFVLPPLISCQPCRPTPF